MIGNLINICKILKTSCDAKYNVTRRLPSLAIAGYESTLRAYDDIRFKTQEKLIKNEPVAWVDDGVPNLTDIDIIRLEKRQYEKLKIKASFFDKFSELDLTPEMKEFMNEVDKEIDFLNNF